MHVCVMVQLLYVLVILMHTGSVRELSKSQTYNLFGLSLKEAFFPIVYPTCCGTASLQEQNIEYTYNIHIHEGKGM